MWIWKPERQDDVYEVKALSQEDAYLRVVQFFYNGRKLGTKKERIAQAMKSATGDYYELGSSPAIDEKPFPNDKLLSEKEYDKALGYEPS